ncbi:hypothetical protein NN561_019504 [Cricetulus griseus]
MAKRGGRLCAGSAPRAGGPRSPAPPSLLLLLLLAGLAPLGEARTPGGDGFSLHPPYFNLAEGARITASATCGEEAPTRNASRPTEDLYCKLVGGPVAGGDPNQTIQVSAGRRAGYTILRCTYSRARSQPIPRCSGGGGGQNPTFPPGLPGPKF